MNDSHRARTRVVITGLGVVSSIGIGQKEFWSNLIQGRSGISRIESFDPSCFSGQYGGEVKDFDPHQFINRRKVNLLGRASQLAIAATRLAIEDADFNVKELPNSKNIGTCIGTGRGEEDLFNLLNRSWIAERADEIEERWIPEYPSNSISSNVGITFNLGGENLVIPTACAAGNYAIGYGFDIIRKNIGTEIMLAGGVDHFASVAFVGFNRLYAMAPSKCQPFDKNRKGMLLGEGAGVLVLESLDSALNRGADIYAEILGYGLSCDAYHMTQPTQEGIAKSMQKAMKESAITVEDVDYISAHGTGTLQNDKTEVAAMKTVFGPKYREIPASSIKSMLGHTMGAASAIEAITCCLALKNGVLPPTINYETPDPDCDIDCLPNEARRKNIQIALNNSSGFGGNNACMVLGNTFR